MGLQAENCLVKKDLGVPVDSQLNKNQQSSQVAKKVDGTLIGSGISRKSVWPAGLVKASSSCTWQG